MSAWCHTPIHVDICLICQASTKILFKKALPCLFYICTLILSGPSLSICFITSNIIDDTWHYERFCHCDWMFDFGSVSSAYIIMLGVWHDTWRSSNMTGMNTLSHFKHAGTFCTLWAVWSQVNFNLIYSKLSVYAFVGKAIADLKCIAIGAQIEFHFWVSLFSQIIPKIVLHPTMYNHTLTEKPLTDLTVIMED